MKETIERVALQLARELNPVLKNSLQLPANAELIVELVDASGRKKRRNASSDNWSPGRDEIRIRFQVGPARTNPTQPQSATTPPPPSAPAPAPNDDASPVADVVRGLAQAENRPGFPFVSLKWFRDQALPGEGRPWTASEEARQSVLRTAIENRLILTSKVPNPKSPQFPVTAIRLNRLLPEVAAILGQAHLADSDFHPVEIKGEPLSVTIMRERHR